MKNEPLFSIVVPVYNGEKFIKKCVRSVLKQDYSNFEIILIDDGSTDESRNICDSFCNKDSRVKVIHKANGGVSIARKEGVEKSRGEYIVCIDADDWIEEDLLLDAARIIAEYHPDILIYGIIRENINGTVIKELPYRKGFYSRRNIKSDIFPILIQAEDMKYFAPSIWGKIFKRILLQDNMIADERAIIGEDGACVIPAIAHAQSMYVMDGYYYNYRYNDVSTTKRKKVFHWEYPRVINEYIMSKIDMDRTDFRDQIYRKIVHDFFNVSFSQFYSNKSYKVVKKEILIRMHEEPYKTAIEKAYFRHSLKAKLMMLSLRGKLVFPLFIYAKVRKY